MRYVLEKVYCGNPRTQEKLVGDLGTQVMKELTSVTTGREKRIRVTILARDNQIPCLQEYALKTRKLYLDAILHNVAVLGSPLKLHPRGGFYWTAKKKALKKPIEGTLDGSI